MVFIMIRLKIVSPRCDLYFDKEREYEPSMLEYFEQMGIQPIYDPLCDEYDWLLVYDDVCRRKLPGRPYELEELMCPREQTILVTQEPPTIKLYPHCFVRQFGYVLTTQDRRYMPYPSYRRGQGCLLWLTGYSVDELLALPEWPKDKCFSTVCSNKQMRHTAHHDRYRLTSYLAAHLPELDWYGHGVRPLKRKYEALSNYKYHLAIENYLHPYHWTEKISDPLLTFCLTFYAGDPKLAEILPEESFVPIPLKDHEAALEIIRKTIRDNEYEKRLPAIREARRLILTKYNICSQVAEVIRNHVPSGAPVRGREYLMGRHRLRRNPLNAISEFAQSVRFRLFDS